MPKRQPPSSTAPFHFLAAVAASATAHVMRLKAVAATVRVVTVVVGRARQSVFRRSRLQGGRIPHVWGSSTVTVVLNVDLEGTEATESTRTAAEVTTGVTADAAEQDATETTAMAGTAERETERPDCKVRMISLRQARLRPRYRWIVVQ